MIPRVEVSRPSSLSFYAISPFKMAVVINVPLSFAGYLRLDFRRLPGPVFDPHLPEQRLLIEPKATLNCELYF